MRFIVSILFALFVGVLSAQSPADWWYFGQNAGVHFTTSGPVGDTNGAMTTGEGCASVSDVQGNLLFYTDGTWVYNALHNVMPDGDSLLGNGSSTQSAVIVPYPGNSDKYYIFTVRGCTGGSTTGLLGQYFSYSVVDMTLESGLGNVDVAQKNVILFDSSAEKCTAMIHANGSDIWAVGHEQTTNKFHAYRLTPTGIIGPVTTEVGPVGQSYCIGYMLANHAGDQIGMVNTSMDSALVFPFDQSTGIVGEPLALGIDGLAYGIHFSPNDELVYVSYTVLHQFDLTATNIQASRVTIDSGTWHGAIAEGPDEKLYLSRSGFYISSIEDPDVYGSGCNFVDSSVYLFDRYCSLGLPNNVAPGLFLIASIQFEGSCVGDSTYFSLDTTNVDDVSWNFGDPGSGASNTTTEFFPSHMFSDTGLFTVRLIVNSDTVSDTAFQNIRIYPRQSVDLGADTAVCTGEQVLFSAKQPYASFLWSDGSTSDSLVVDGEPFVKVTVFGRCDTVSDSVFITYDDSIFFNLGPDTLLCGGDSLTLNTFITDSSVIQWSTGDSIPAITVTVSGTYEVNAINACGSFKDTINVEFKPIPSFDLLPSDTINCFDNEIVLSHNDLDSVTYVWSDSSTKKNYRVYTTETVWLAAFNDCGSSIDTINIIFNGEIISELGEDTTICDLDTLVLNAYSPGATYAWSTGDSIDSILTGTTSELYVVTVTQGLCKTIESKRVDLSEVLCPGIDCDLKTRNVFTPNGDGVNDIWRASSDCEITSYGLNIYNRWGQLIHHSSNAAFGWDGYVQGIPAAEGVYYYELTFKDKVIVAVDSEEFRGSITLMR